MSPAARTILVVCLVPFVIAAPFALVPSVLLVVAGETAAGRLFGLLGVAVTAIPFLVGYALASGRRRVATAVTALAASLLVVLAALTPPGIAPGARVRSSFPGPAHYRRFAIANLLPEIDQIKLGTYLVPALDSIITVRSARRLRELTMAIYRPMEADPDFRALGSVMSDAYDDRDSGHVYEYVPPAPDGARLPAILFLHGSAGNFKAYFYAWRGFADAHRYVVLCPSFGWGDWYHPGGIEAVERARRHAVADLPVDPSRIYLVGLSNGGTGVTRVAAANPEAYAGLVFLSAVMEPEVLGKAAFRRGWRGRSVLVIHGAKDDRIPIRSANAAVALLRDMGARLTYRVYEDEDHFLLFSKPTAAFDDVARWLEP